MKPVKQVDVKKNYNVNQLLTEMGLAGVMGAGRIAKAADIFEKMVKEKNCKVFLGVAGALVPGGMKDILIDMLDRRLINVLVITGANLTHDLVEALGYHHYQGSADVDDSKLYEKKIDRIYDSFMLNKVYEGMEDFFKKNIAKFEKPMNIKQFLWTLGSLIPKNNKSILRTCYEKKIPVFCPAIADSGIGLMVWGNLEKGKKIKVDAFDDLREMSRIAWDCKKAGFLYLGGGFPKNYIQQALQFSPKGADYGIQITMDRPEHGGSSGAELREGKSWGKLSKEAKFVDVICDVTIALPIIYSALLQRL